MSIEYDTPRKGMPWYVWLVIGLWSLVIIGSGIFYQVNHESNDSIIAPVADAAAEISQGQIASWDQLGEYAVTDLQLKRTNSDVSKYLDDDKLNYQILYLKDSQILLKVQSERDLPKPTIIVLIEAGEIASVSCVVVSDKSCKDSSVLSPYL